MDSAPSHQPLYLKYRPRKLSELLGQKLVVRILSNSILRRKLAHAYLLTGPRGSGKTSTARIIAKSINCQREMSPEPCGKCSNCLEISKGISPDVIEMDAASHRGVEDAARIIERAHLRAQKSRFRVYILDEVHMLSNTAFNALLKTIEEPPSKVVFILATTEEHKVPQTIISRCQQFNFRPIELETLKAHLKKVSEFEQIKVSEEALDRISKQSRGGLRDALGLLEQVSILGLSSNSEDSEPISDQAVFELLGLVSEDKLEKFLFLLQEQKSYEVLTFLEQLLQEGTNPLQFLRNFLEFSIETLEKMLPDSQREKRELLLEIVSRLFELENSLRTTSNTSLKLKSAMISICDRLKFREEKREEKREERKEERKEEKKVNTGKSKVEEITKVSSNSEQRFLVEELLERIDSIPIKSLLKASKAVCLEDSQEKVVLEIPQKVFYEKLKEKTRIEKIHQVLKELKENQELVFEIKESFSQKEEQNNLLKGDLSPSNSLKEEKKKSEESEKTERPIELIQPVVIAKAEEENILKESAEEIWSKAEYILGAKRIRAS